MDRDERQARFIKDQGWIAARELETAREELGMLGGAWRDGLDLAGLLESRGLLTAKQVEVTRQRDAMATRPDEVKTVDLDPAGSAALIKAPRFGGGSKSLLNTGTQSAFGGPGAASAEHDSRPAPKPRAKARPEKAPESGPQALPKVGEEISGYRIEGELSRGGMGVIYRATHVSSGEVVALKLMLSKSARQEVVLARFRREVKVLIRLKHRHIVEIFDFGIYKDLPYYAMELIEGSDVLSLVRERMRSGKRAFSSRTVVQVFLSLAEALAYCHANNVVHRDIKPQNIVIEKETGRPVLVDFGLMKQDEGSLYASADSLTKTGEAVGTPAFMSPEQFSPSGAFGDIGAKTDVWGLTATLYFCLTGAPPYNFNSAVAIFRSMARQDAARVRSLAEDTPEWLDQLVADGLARETAARPSMDELLDRFRRAGRKRRPVFRFLFLGAAAALLIAGAFALGLFALRKDPALFAGPPEAAAARTRLNQIEVKGFVSRGGVRVRINKEVIRSEPSGFYRAKVALLEGENRIEVEVLNEGQERPLEVLKVYCDRRPPQLRFANQRRIGDTPYAIVRGGKARVQVEEEELQSFEAEGFAMTEDSNAIFLLQFPKGFVEQELRFRALDALGNETRRSMIFVSEEEFQRLQSEDFRERMAEQARAAVSEERSEFWRTFASLWRLEDSRRWDRDVNLARYPPPLALLSAWRTATEEEREAALAVVRSRLDARYEFVDTMESPGAVPIPRFRHRESGLEFCLLPGGFVDMADYERLRVLDTILEAGFDEKEERIDKDALDGYFNFLPYFTFSGVRETAETEEAFQDYWLASVTRLKELRSTLINSANDWTELDTRVHYIPPMLVGRYEVNLGEWKRYAEPPEELKDSPDDLPLVHICHLDAADWLDKVGDGFRFIERDEWLYLARGGSRTAVFWGGGGAERARRFARLGYDDDLSSPKPRAAEPNGFGLVDTLGGVWEMCGLRGGRYVPVFGGGSTTPFRYARPELFQYMTEEEGGPEIGLRVAVSIPAVPFRDKQGR